MSLQHADAIARLMPRWQRVLPSNIPETLLRRVLSELRCGELAVETPTGRTLVVTGSRPGPKARIAIHRWRSLWQLLRRGDLGFAEAFMAGDWTTPDLIELLRLADANEIAAPSRQLPIGQYLRLRLRHAMNRNTRWGSRRNIAAHYDLGNDFYAQWLDRSMTYSAGLFSSATESLEAAQEAKLDRVLDLLDLTGRDAVLEIGCGWGSFAERFVERNSGRLTGVTLSAEQLAYAKRRLRPYIHSGQCELRLQDYRDIGGTYDRIVSIEMLEAVGEAYWPTYFAKLRDALRPGGVAVLQVITIDEKRFAHYRCTPDFIQTHIFPGGMLPTADILRREAHAAQLDLVTTEFFPESYSRTLEHWAARFRNAWPRIEALGFDARFKRMWEYYLAYCQAGFETGAITVGFYKMARGSAR